MGYGTKQEGERDLSKWTLPKLLDIFSGTVASRYRNCANNATANLLFSYKDTRMVYKKFAKYETITKDETRISHLNRLDAIITDAIESLDH